MALTGSFRVLDDSKLSSLTSGQYSFASKFLKNPAQSMLNWNYLGAPKIDNLMKKAGYRQRQKSRKWIDGDLNKLNSLLAPHIQSQLSNAQRIMEGVESGRVKIRQKNGLVKQAISIAAPIAGFAVAGPLGAGLGSAASSFVSGGDWKDALKAGALSYGGGKFAQWGGFSKVGSKLGLTGKLSNGFKLPSLPGGTSLSNIFSGGNAAAYGLDSRLANYMGNGSSLDSLINSNLSSNFTMLGSSATSGLGSQISNYLGSSLPMLSGGQNMGFLSGLGDIAKKAVGIGADFLGGGGLGDIFSIGGQILDYTGAKDMQGAYGDAVRAADPFGPHRAGYANKLAKLYKNPSYIENLPGYQFALNQGLQGVDRRMSQGGYLNSGNRMLELTDYASGLASQMYNSEANRLAMLAGAGSGNFGEAAGNIVAGAGAETNANNVLLGGLKDIFDKYQTGTPPISQPTYSDAGYGA